MAKLQVFSRKKWTRKSNTAPRVVWRLRRRDVVVHHSAGPCPGKHASIAEEAEYMRSIDDFHRNGRGWTHGIGYGYMIMRSGRVWVARGFARSGAHAPARNSHPGVCFAGNYAPGNMTPTHESLVAFWQLRKYLKRRGVRGLKPIRHGDVFSTSCPGVIADHLGI